MRLMIVSIALALSLLALSLCPALAQGALPSLPRDTDYGRARRVLQAEGWRPARLPDAEVCPPGDDRCRGRPEMYACAGTGLANCIFTWRRGARVIEVLTVGEGPVTVTRVRCRSGCR